MCLLRFIRSPAVTHPAWGDRHAHRAVLCFKAHAHARGEGACRKAFIRANGTQSTARFPEPQAIGCTMSDWGMGCAVHRALASPRLSSGRAAKSRCTQSALGFSWRAPAKFSSSCGVRASHLAKVSSALASGIPRTPPTATRLARSPVSRRQASRPIPARTRADGDAGDFGLEAFDCTCYQES